MDTIANTHPFSSRRFVCCAAWSLRYLGDAIARAALEQVAQCGDGSVWGYQAQAPMQGGGHQLVLPRPLGGPYAKHGIPMLARVEESIEGTALLVE